MRSLNIKPIFDTEFSPCVRFLDGKRAEACAAVPQELVDQVALVGSKERVADKLVEWKEAADKRHVDTLIARTNSIDTIRFLAEQVL